MADSSLCNEQVVLDGYGGDAAVTATIECPDTLPFTGFDLWLVVLGAVVLFALGLAIRKYASLV